MYTSALYCEVNMFSIAVLIILCISCSVFGRGKKIKTKLFKIAVLSAAIASIDDIIWKIYSVLHPVPSVHILSVLNCIYFACLGLCVYFTALFFEPYGKKSIFKNKKLMIVAVVPLAVMLVMLAATPYNGYLFYYNESLRYTRGKMFWILPVVLYGYIFVAAVRRIIKASKKHRAVFREETAVIALVTAPLILCGVCQWYYVDMPSAPFALTVSFLIIYINSLKTIIVTDNLTGINNRVQLLKKLDEQILNLKKDERLYFLFIDIDAFKQINDIYGHAEGDRALKTVAGVLKDVCAKTNGFCARYGGDEFALIQILKDNENIDTLIKIIKNEVKKKSILQNLAYLLDVSIGSAAHTENIGDIDELISKADGSMYSNKKRVRRKN